MKYLILVGSVVAASLFGVTEVIEIHLPQHEHTNTTNKKDSKTTCLPQISCVSPRVREWFYKRNLASQLMNACEKHEVKKIPGILEEAKKEGHLEYVLMRKFWPDQRTALGFCYVYGHTKESEAIIEAIKDEKMRPFRIKCKKRAQETTCEWCLF